MLELMLLVVLMVNLLCAIFCAKASAGASKSPAVGFCAGLVAGPAGVLCVLADCYLSSQRRTRLDFGRDRFIRRRSWR